MPEAYATHRLHLRGSRLAIIAFGGPLVGAVLVFAISLASAVPEVTMDDFVAMGSLILFMGWLIGLLPAVLAALVVRQVGLAPHYPRRLFEAAAIGGLCSLLSLPVLFGLTLPPSEAATVIVLCGAVALCATALPDLRSKG